MKPLLSCLLPGARLAGPVLLSAVLLAAAPLAHADVGPDHAAAVASQVSGGGRVLSVDRAGGGRVWRVKVVTPRGEVRVVMVDVATGRPQ